MEKPENPPQAGHEPDFQGSLWKNPYFLFVVLNLLIFLFLIGAGTLAYNLGWIPSR